MVEVEALLAFGLLVFVKVLGLHIHSSLVIK